MPVGSVYILGHTLLYTPECLDFLQLNHIINAD
jgi:hypothetical protein